MAIKISVGVSEQEDDREVLERRRKRARNTGPGRDNAPDQERMAGWPLGDARDTTPQGPNWAW